MVSFSQTNNEESNSQTLKNDALMKDIIGYMVYPINARNCCLMICFLSKHGDVINQKLRHERKENGHLTNQRKHESQLC